MEEIDSAPMTTSSGIEDIAGEIRRETRASSLSRNALFVESLRWRRGLPIIQMGHRQVGFKNRGPGAA